MALRPILILPDPQLRLKCAPVAVVDDKIRALMDDMLETMYDAPGIGLAAIQVGVPKRVIVVDVAKRQEESASERKIGSRRFTTSSSPPIMWQYPRSSPHTPPETPTST